MWECIFIRAELSVRTLIQLSAFHTEWRAAVSSRSFIRSYDLSDSGRTEMLIMPTQDKDTYWLYSTISRSWVNAIDCPDVIRGLPVAGSCRGLICVTDIHGHGDGINPPIYIWNPSRRSLRVLPQGELLVPEHVLSNIVVPTAIGIDLDRSSFEYEVLKICCTGLTHLQTPLYQVEIYSLAANIWRRLPDLNQALGENGVQMDIRFQSVDGLYSEGCLYWCLTRDCRGILCYNMAIQQFMLKPYPVPPMLLNDITFCIGVYDVALSFLSMRQNNGLFTCEVHVKQTDEENQEHWTAIYTIDQANPFATSRPLLYTPRGGYLLGTESEVTHNRSLIILNPETDEEIAFEIDFPHDEEEFYIDYFTENLPLL